MQEVITKNIIRIVAVSWFDTINCAEFEPTDVDELRHQDGGLDRESIRNWIYQHLTNEFMLVYDLYADLYLDSVRGDLIIDWQNSESSGLFERMMNPVTTKEEDFYIIEHF